MNIEVDETDAKSLNALIAHLCKIRNKLCKTDPKARISNARFEARLKAIEKESAAIGLILDTDISSIFSSENDSTEFYVYAHCNPLATLRIKEDARHLAAAQLGLVSQPFYIGKGTGNRAQMLDRNEGHRKIRQFLHKKNSEVQIVKLRENLTEAEALAFESKLIDIFGLRAISPLGLLVNLDEGLCSRERRALYPKGVPWYLNKLKLQPYSVPKG